MKVDSTPNTESHVVSIVHVMVFAGASLLQSSWRIELNWDIQPAERFLQHQANLIPRKLACATAQRQDHLAEAEAYQPIYAKWRQ